MKNEELNIILKEHNLWLDGDTRGKRADLRGANLQLVNLQGADLRKANLMDANLKGTELNGANLMEADLKGADLRGTDLRGADLKGANIDYSSFALWCGCLCLHIDDKQAIQFLYYLISNIDYSRNISKELKEKLLTKDIVELANRFHRVDECGKIDWSEKGND